MSFYVDVIPFFFSDCSSPLAVDLFLLHCCLSDLIVRPRPARLDA
jgi:hypothetical protein